MRIGVISDTHLKKVDRKFVQIYETYLQDKDMVLHAGDVVSPEIVDYLEGDNFYGVCGNMDPPQMRSRMPEHRILQIGGFRVGLIHGWGRAEDLEDRIIPLFPDVDVIVYGHTHLPVHHYRNGVFLFNPGTATGFSNLGVNTLGVLELNDTIQGWVIPL